MARASENASQILSELMVRYSRLRQESITNEMLELARGTEPAHAGKTEGR